MTTPYQLQAWRAEFEETPTKGEFGFELLGTFYAREGEYKNRALAYQFKGYLRRYQETEQAVKLMGKAAIISTQHARKQTLEEVLVIYNGALSFSDSKYYISNKIKELLT